MPRTARAAAAGVVYHVLNRGNGRMSIFRKPGDYAAFLQLLADGKDKACVELFGFCLLPNHWHLVLRFEPYKVHSPFRLFLVALTGSVAHRLLRGGLALGIVRAVK
ncbi:MAG TPA: transposase [Tepidisphaeraceae bacterium]|jgi:REP element-mobilizing transposase RayT